jgi:Ser/Thr protein kinase RdoA (MazF antagonist)
VSVRVHDDEALSAAWLSPLLTASPEWRYGAVEVMRTTRIGADRRPSGRTYRVLLATESGAEVSVVVKQESSEALVRELLFRRHCEESLRGEIPKRLGATRDDGAGDGVLVLEDVVHAEQGDVLRGCTDERADAVVRALARIHAASWAPNEALFPAELPRWDGRPLEPGRWADRLTCASERYPEILTARRLERLSELPTDVASAVAVLRQGPAAWIHQDAHLENVLWRPDGTAVLLDWGQAAIGPPAVDLARLFTDGLDAVSSPGRQATLAAAYIDELRARGIPTDGVTELRHAVVLAAVPLVQGAVAWAGDDDAPPGGWRAALRENLLRWCAWLRAS